MTKKPPSRVRTIRVRTPTARYPVWVGAGLLRESGRRLQRLRPRCRRLYVISSPRVWALWGTELARGLRTAGIRLETLLMDDREEKKRAARLEDLASELLARRADRGALLAALGGGVVGDVTGFLAAAYMRGVSYLQIPTTLVGQVDSAIGGKTGVNLPAGKNLLGAFYHPVAVLVDPRTLGSLPAREYRAGLYEVVKCAVIGDPVLFRFLEEKMASVLGRDPAAVERVLVRSIRLKAQIVGRDEREENLRRILNFGHTVGHALETLSGYHGLRHGEAVGWGMIAATHLAERQGKLSAAAAQRILRLVRAVGRLPRLPRLSAQRIYEQLFADKKKHEAGLRFVLPRRVGQVEVVGGIPRPDVLASLRQLDGVLPAR
jgi:3-dehydroquinate synthase